MLTQVEAQTAMLDIYSMALHGILTALINLYKSRSEDKKSDLFSVAVTIFIIVTGQFPFMEAVKDDYYYALLIAKKHEKYWK